MKMAPLLALGFLGLLAGLRAQEPIITAQCAILFDANTGKVIYKKNENERRAVASTQKLLTALIIAESGELSAPVTIDRSDMLAAPTKLYLKTGDTYTRQQLLTALLIKSPNDAARALARDNAGSVEDFAAKMNARMARLGGDSSHFVNPNGLPADDQYSTARDMARVARAVYFNPLLREIIRTKHCMFRLRQREDDLPAKYQPGAPNLFVLQWDEDGLHGRRRTLLDFERILERQGYDCRRPRQQQGARLAGIRFASRLRFGHQRHAVGLPPRPPSIRILRNAG